MIQIEKLKNIIQNPPMGLVDMLSLYKVHAANPLNINFDVSFIRVYIELNLKHISIGKEFGCRGVEINQLLTTDDSADLVIETSYQNFLNLPSAKQKKLLENFTVMFSDFEENGLTIGNLCDCIRDVIARLQVLPKHIIILTAETNQTGIPELNIDIVYFPCLAILTGCVNTTRHLITDPSAREHARNKIINDQKKFCLSPNRKPRPNRVKLLAELDNHNLLDNMDWSLAYNPIPTGTKSDYGKILLSPTNAQFNNILHQDHSLDKFLKKYSWPRVFKELGNLTYTISNDWIGKYKWYISAEAYDDSSEKNSFGFLNIVTEKTMKAFYIGAYPIILGNVGMHQHLKNLGLKMKECEYDLYEGQSRIPHIVEFVKQLNDRDWYLEEILYNFDTVTDPQWVINLTVKALDSITNCITLRK